MTNKSDTLHRIRRIRQSVRALDKGINSLVFINPYSAGVLKEDKMVQMLDLIQLEDLAKRMGWKYENL